MSDREKYVLVATARTIQGQQAWHYVAIGSKAQMEEKQGRYSFAGMKNEHMMTAPVGVVMPYPEWLKIVNARKEAKNFAN